MSNCIKNGATVYLADYGATVHCDLYEEEYAYVIAYVGTFNNADVDDKDIDLFVYEIDVHLESAKVIIAVPEECRKTPKLESYLD